MTLGCMIVVVVVVLGLLEGLGSGRERDVCECLLEGVGRCWSECKG